VLQLTRMNPASTRVHLLSGAGINNTTPTALKNALNNGTTGTSMVLPWDGHNVSICFNAAGSGGCRAISGTTWADVTDSIQSALNIAIAAVNVGSVTGYISPVTVSGITSHGDVVSGVYADFSSVGGTNLYPGGVMCLQSAPHPWRGVCLALLPMEMVFTLGTLQTRTGLFQTLSITTES